MKKFILLLLFSLFIFSVKSQIKVWPGGEISVGTTTDAPTGYYRSLFYGPTYIQQSNQDQTLLFLNATNQITYSNTTVSHAIRPKVKNYVTSFIKSNYHTFWVYSDGNVWAKKYHKTSDSTTKTQITTIDSALYKIEQLRGVYFKYKLEVDSLQYYDSLPAKFYMGVIAQEVAPIIPEIIDTTENGLLGVDYTSLSGLFIEGIKDLNNKVDDLWKLNSKGDVYRDSAYVGIGTTDPLRPLDVIGATGIAYDGYHFLLDDSLLGSPYIKGAVMAYTDTAANTSYVNGIVTAGGNNPLLRGVARQRLAGVCLPGLYSIIKLYL